MPARDDRQRKRFAVVGTGGRCRMFLDAAAGRFADHAELVGLCDPSATRMAHWNRHLADTFGHPPLPAYPPGRFDAMVAETRPDVVVVTSVDATHHTYIVRALELGCEAVTEKPMATDAEKVAAVFEAVERTGGEVRVAFNYRWMPVFSALKGVVASGAVGRPTLVDFQWRLDTSHGADYFRRWHREKKHSGGLLVHKATHHFDLVNWILDDRPERVFALGGLAFYGGANAAARGLPPAPERFTGEPDAADDPFALDLAADPGLRGLYLDAEADSGYVRDRHVFGGESKWPITSEDTMAVTARMAGGALLNYSLVAYCPWEGERLSVVGTEGHVEYFGRGPGHIIAGQGDDDLAAAQRPVEQTLRLQRHFEPSRDLPIPEAEGGHGGGDARLLERLFLPDLPPDPLGRDASHHDGAWSVLAGVAANRSIETGRPVGIGELAPPSLCR
ncbi:MAG: Gfo/Idh/MocA family oxidoreductase [Planctomycetota bacterium]